MKREAIRTVTAMLSMTWAAAACGPAETAKAPEAQPLVVGTSPPAPVETAPAPLAAPGGATEERAKGDASPIELGSLTTPGKVFIPANRVVVVHFFATWCAPCTRTMPKLQELYASHRARGVEVIAVSVDDEVSGVGEFARKNGAKFPVGWDPGHALAGMYQVEMMPTTYVIDRKGNIAFKHGGYVDNMFDSLLKEVEGLL